MERMALSLSCSCGAHFEVEDTFAIKVDQVVVGDGPEGLAVSPTGGYAVSLLTNGSGGSVPNNAFFRHDHAVAVLLQTDGKKVHKLGETEVGTLAEGIAFSPDGQFVVQLQDHLRSLVEPKIAEHRGRVVKTGGGVLLEFPFYRPDSDDRATRFAVDCKFSVLRHMSPGHTLGHDRVLGPARCSGWPAGSRAHRVLPVRLVRDVFFAGLMAIGSKCSAGTPRCRALRNTLEPNCLSSGRAGQKPATAISRSLKRSTVSAQFPALLRQEPPRPRHSAQLSAVSDQVLNFFLEFQDVGRRGTTASRDWLRNPSSSWLWRLPRRDPRM